VRWARYAPSKIPVETHILAYGPAPAASGLDFGCIQREAPALAVVRAIVQAAALHGNLLPVGDYGDQTCTFRFVGTVAVLIIRNLESRTALPAPVSLAFESRMTLTLLVGYILKRRLDVGQPRTKPCDIRDYSADRVGRKMRASTDDQR